jgi:hypothetical protein
MVLERISKAYGGVKLAVADKVRSARIGSPDVILVGEEHGNKRAKEEQAAIIRRYRPEYVLLEALDGRDPDKTDVYTRLYSTATLNELSSSIGLSLDDMGIRPDAYIKVRRDAMQSISEEFEDHKKIFDEYKKEHPKFRSKFKPNSVKKAMKIGVIPESQVQLLETPFYELDSRVLESLEGVISKNISESACPMEVINKQGRALSHIYNIQSVSRKSGYNDIIFREVGKIGGMLAGCDISKSDMPKIENVDDQGSISEYFQTLSDYVKGKDMQREEEMGRRTALYAGKRQTKRPIVAIVGRDHLKGDSYAFKPLDDAGIKYKVIMQRPTASPAESLVYSIRLGA